MPQNKKSTGALRLLSELDSLAHQLGTDLENAKVTQSAVNTTTQSKTIKLSKVSSPYHGQAFEQAIKGGYLDMDTGTYIDFSGKNHVLADAFEKDLINPDSAVFINPSDNQTMTVHNAIQRGLLQRTGHYIEPISGQRLPLAEAMAKSLVVTREVEPLPIDSQKTEEHVQIHVVKVSLLFQPCWALGHPI